MTNLKTNCFYTIAGLIAGIYIGLCLLKKPQPEIKYVEKESGTIERKIYITKDGEKHIIEKENYIVSKSLQKSIEIKHNTIQYIPKYNFETNKIYQSFAYSYDNIGIYLSENKEAGLVFSFSW